MKTTRMWNLGLAAVLCCSPAIAQAPGGGQSGGQMGGQAGGQSSGMGSQNSPSSMQQQAPQQMGGATGSAGPAADKMFLKKALEGNMAEVQMGQLALQKSSDDQVKQFAQRMVDDHGKVLDQLKPLAEQMSVKVPDSPGKGAMKTMDKMNGLSGDAFDQAYIKDMVKDHKEDDKEFKQEAQTTQNPQLKQLATDGAQTIDSHLQMIEQIAQQKGGGGAMKSKM